MSFPSSSKDALTKVLQMTECCHTTFVISSMANRGGTQRVTSELASALASKGYVVDVVALFDSERSVFPVDPLVSVNGLNLESVDGKPMRYLRAANQIHKYLGTRRREIVVVVDSILVAFCLKSMALSRSVFVCWEHFNLSTYSGSRVRGWARVAAARWCRAVVVLTERDAEAWRTSFGLSDKVMAIANSVPVGLGMPSAFRERENIVLGVGRLTEQKGFDMLVAAWQKLGPARRGWRLRILGAGEDQGKLLALAYELDVADSIEFAGSSSEMELEYKAASIFAMSSRWEGLPMTLLEAQHFGLPCLSTDCETGPREILGTDAGLLVPVDDADAFAASLSVLIKDCGLREKLAATATENIKRYHPAEILNQWIDLIALISSRSHR